MLQAWLIARRTFLSRVGLGPVRPFASKPRNIVRRIGAVLERPAPEPSSVLIWSIGNAGRMSTRPASNSATPVAMSLITRMVRSLKAGFGPQYSSLRVITISWPRSQRTNLYGPVPTAFSATHSAPLLLSTFSEMNCRFCSRSTNTGYGLLVCQTIWVGSTTSILSMASQLPRCGLLVSGLSTRSTLDLTVWAVNESPLWNLTSPLSSISHVVSLVAFQEVASHGPTRLVS